MKKTCITGAKSGMGAAISLHLAQQKHELFLHAHRSFETPLHELASGIKQTLFKADFSDLEQVFLLAQQIKTETNRLDYLIHNAAIFESLPFEKIDLKRYEQMMNVNLHAPFFLTQALLPLLQQSPHPVIVFIIDAYVDRPWPHHAHYMLSKGALKTLIKCLANELAPRIRVCGIAPGPITFPSSYSKEKRESIIDGVPMKRTGNYNDICLAIDYLLNAPYANGEILFVDGGQHNSSMKMLFI